MKQIELFPYLIDQEVIDYHRIVLRELNLLTKAKYDLIRVLNEYEKMRLKAIEDSKQHSVPEIKYRIFLKKIETNVNNIFQDEDLKNIDSNIEKWSRRKELVEFEINSSTRFCT